MRGIAYVVAALAAVGIMIAIATVPGPDTEPPRGSAATVEPVPSETAGRVMPEAGTLVMSVPTMHCEFACFPSIKKVLEESVAVTGVELAEQKEEGVIDNRAVVINYDAGFDVDAAIATLEKNGFDEAHVVP
jgi:copper chaperone CopZ